MRRACAIEGLGLCAEFIGPMKEMRCSPASKPVEFSYWQPGQGPIGTNVHNFPGLVVHASWRRSTCQLHESMNRHLMWRFAEKLSSWRDFISAKAR